MFMSFQKYVTVSLRQNKEDGVKYCNNSATLQHIPNIYNGDLIGRCFYK